MAGNGGKRPGAGRKPKADEERVMALAKKAIAQTYGSEDEGFEALLKSGEPALVKFVWEHAYGKPKDTIKHEGDGLTKLLNIDPLSNVDHDAADNSTA